MNNIAVSQKNIAKYLDCCGFAMYICVINSKYKNKTYKMQIRTDIIERINTVDNRVKLAAELKVGEQAIYAQIKRNTPDGYLTKIRTLNAIAKILGEKNIKNLIE